MLIGLDQEIRLSGARYFMLGARELADVDPVKPAQPVDLVSILAIATDTELSAIPQYAQQDSNLRPTD
jgi:hypothetical protein